MGSRGDRGHMPSGNPPPQFTPDGGAPAHLGPRSGGRPSSGKGNGNYPPGGRPSSRPSSQGHHSPGPSSGNGQYPNGPGHGGHGGGNYPNHRPSSKQGSPGPRNGDPPPQGGYVAPPQGGYNNMPPPAFIPGGGPPPGGGQFAPPGGGMPQPLRGPAGPSPVGGLFVPGGGSPPAGAYAAPEAIKPERSVEHKAAMEAGYAPAAFQAAKQGNGPPEEDTDPVLKELNATWPNALASIVAKSPALSMLLMFVILLAAAAPAFIPTYAPSPLTEFDSLQIKDHPAAASAFSVTTLEDQDTFFRKPEDVDQPAPAGVPEDDNAETGRRLTALFTGDSGPEVQFYTTADASVMHGMMHAWRGVGEAFTAESRRLGGAGSKRLLQQDEDEQDIPTEEDIPDDIADVDPGGIDLGDVSVDAIGAGNDDNCYKEERNLGESRFLVIFYRYATDDPDDDAPNAITAEMVAKARKVEERIKAYPEFSDICARECSGECQEILSFATFVHTSKESYLTGEITLEEEPVWDLQEAGEFLVANNFTFFFNIESNGTTSIWLRSIVPFRQENGLGRGKFPYEDSLVPKLIRMFEEENTDDIVINYGEFVINSVQINQQIFRDLRWAALSMFLAGVMLRVGSGSNFMTFAGLFQIIISFPISWLVYSAPKGWKFVNFIHFLAPFVMLGIGLDDIFVSIAFFQNTRPFMGYFALDTRLTMAFQQASSAMLATSTTSAFAFAANIFSPVPAIQSFGLLLATLVIINYILAITWLPVCLAVWDKHFEFPKRAAEARGDSTCCSCTLFSCCGCGGCLRKQGRMGNMGQTLRIIKGGQEPRALEFMQVVLPFWRTMKVTKQIEQHRLLHPEKPPILISREQLAHVNEDNAYKIFGRTIDVRKIIAIVFDFVFKYRWITISACLLATAFGTAGTIALTAPPTSEPPIFESDHNVQFFYRYITGNESDNVPTCTACLQSTMELWSEADAAADSPGDFFDLSQPLIGFEEGGYSTVVSDIIYGVAENGIDNSPNTKDGDPAGAPEPNKLTFEPTFDISTIEAQQMVQEQLDDLVTYTTPEEGRSLFTSMEYNPLDKIRLFCNPETEEDVALYEREQRGRYCDDANGLDGLLPTGNKFNALVFRLLATTRDITIRDYMGYIRQEESGLSAFEFIECSNDFGLGCDKPFPKLDWLRIQVRTTTAKNEAPEKIVRAYDQWRVWSNTTQQSSSYKGQFVASPDWVTAVTYNKISNSVYGTVFLSIGLAAAVVFVFCGPLMMLLAAITVLMINLTVMGVLYLWEWNLGAVEAMSITSLVGLSVDFCIHMSEAFNHASATWTPDRAASAKNACISYLCSPQPKGREKAKEALILVAIPMVASAVSTVITTTPLFAAVTLILKRFAAVIFVTMLVGLAYVILFLTPMLAMFGPGPQQKKTMAEDTPLRVVVTDMLLKSKGVRFVGTAFIAVFILLAIPATNERLGSGDALQELMVMLLAAAVGALCLFIASAFIRASFHKKRHLEQQSRQEKEQFAQYQQKMARPSNVPAPAI